MYPLGERERHEGIARAIALEFIQLRRRQCLLLVRERLDFLCVCIGCMLYCGVYGSVL